jgi:hypothetical protein
VKKRVRKSSHCTETREREKSQENRVKACSKFLISTNFPGYSAGITGSQKKKKKKRVSFLRMMLFSIVVVGESEKGFTSTSDA